MWHAIPWPVLTCSMKWKRILKRSAFVVVGLFLAWFQFAYWSSTNDCQQSVLPGGERMKAIKFCEYGPPDVLSVVTSVSELTPDEYVPATGSWATEATRSIGLTREVDH
jgi:hypothetical protein